jgi:hypothetical protein
MANEHGTAATVKVALLERERLIDPQSGAPEQHDQRAETLAVSLVANNSHDRDNLLDGWRIGGILLALISWRAASVIAGHGRGRAAMAGDVQQNGHESSRVGTG